MCFLLFLLITFNGRASCDNAGSSAGVCCSAWKSKKKNAAHRNVFSCWVATEETTMLYFLTSFAWLVKLELKKIFLCTNTHLHFSFRCYGWIWAKDWSSVSRACSCCQRIHCKTRMLRSGKVSSLLVQAQHAHDHLKEICCEKMLRFHVLCHFATTLVCFKPGCTSDKLESVVV